MNINFLRNDCHLTAATQIKKEWDLSTQCKTMFMIDGNDRLTCPPKLIKLLNQKINGARLAITTETFCIVVCWSASWSKFGPLVGDLSYYFIWKGNARVGVSLYNTMNIQTQKNYLKNTQRIVLWTVNRLVILQLHQEKPMAGHCILNVFSPITCHGHGTIRYSPHIFHGSMAQAHRSSGHTPT